MMPDKKRKKDQKVLFAQIIVNSYFEPNRSRRIIWLLTACVALMMTGMGIIMPVFARRLSEFGDGVEALGFMTMSFALAQFIASPIMGSLADRFGRRPLILLSLISYTLVNIGFLLASSTGMFILVRTLGGLLTAGLFPAAMGVVTDITPSSERSRWVGIVMGGYGMGLIFGPVLGGVLYDTWGYASPFIISALAAFLALLAALAFVPETRLPEQRRRDALRLRRQKELAPQKKTNLWSSFPQPLYIFFTLLFLDFINSFAFAYVEPQMIFYFYDELGWSTSYFGIVVGVYGVAMVFGQTILGQLSDRFGRKPIIILGLLLSSSLFVGLAFLTSFAWTLPVALISGLGAALIAPALSAFYLDLTPEQNRSQIVGFKGSIASLGSVAGPLLIVIATQIWDSSGVFLSAGILVILAALLSFILLKEPKRLRLQNDDLDWEISRQRSLAAQAVTRGIVLQARRQRSNQNFLIKNIPFRKNSVN